MEVRYRDYFKEPLSRSEIVMLLQGRPVGEMFNFRSPSFKAMGMDKRDLSDDKLIELMLGNPRFIRRPVVKIGREVYFGASADILASIMKM